MNNLENRIDKLEKQTGDSKPDRKTMVLIGPPDEKTLADAIAESIRLGITPDMIGDPNVIWVKNAEAKELTERIIAGEGTE